LTPPLITPLLPSPSRWSLAEHLAFECALVNDEHKNWNDLKQRDDKLTIPADVLAAGDRRTIAQLWLAAYLQQDAPVKEASGSLHQTLAIVGQLLALAGFFGGLTLAATALAYTGQAPINVSAFFSVFVLLQALLAVLIALPFLLPLKAQSKLTFGPLFRPIRGLFIGLYNITQKAVSRLFSARKRQRAAEITAEAVSRMMLHQDVLKWLVFRKAQVMALGFNLGVLLALLAAVVFTDRAFGWQTTLDVSAATIHALVQGIATPWAWLLGDGVGVPSLQQIEDSRIRLQHGMAALNADGLASWWRFLALGIITYGILPRLLFYGLGRLQLRRALNRYDFRNAAAERLFTRLLPSRTLFETELATAASSTTVTSLAREPLPAAQQREHKVFTYCSLELAGGIDFDHLRALLAQRWQLPTSHLHLRVYDHGDTLEIPAVINDGDQFALVFESWLPPITEVERQIRNLRQRIHPRNLIRIVLLGIPAPSDANITLMLEPRYGEPWQAFVQRQGDPYLMLDNPA
jgi:hypothetical protein